MTRFVVILAIVGSTTAGVAQSPPQATILADWERARANVLRYVDAAPDSMMGYRPTPGVRTFAQQIQHVVESNVDVGAMAVRGLPGAPVIGDTAHYLHEKAALHGYVAEAYDYVIASIRTATPAQLARVSVMYGQPASPAWRWLELAQEHAVWTLGQIVPYLRLNGVSPPAYNMPF